MHKIAMTKKILSLFLFLLLFLSFCAYAEEVNLPIGLTELVEETFAQDSSIQKIIIADGTKAIGPGVFSGCTGLSEITLPVSLESIDETAFEGCEQLETVYAVSYTWACQWAMERGYTVLEITTEQPLTPFSYDIILIRF